MSKSPPLTVCLLDDERIALLNLQTLLQEEGVRIQCATISISEALQSIKQHRPDALFLDIQMPEASGFEVVERIPVDLPVIFVTASDAHAIRAFEVNALDYLVKPVQIPRLRQSLRRLLTQNVSEEKPSLLGPDDLVCLPMDHGRVFIQTLQIVGIESQTNYSRVHLADSRRLVVKRSLNEWEKKLDSRHFLRINRRWIIQLARVEQVESKGTECLIRLKGSDAPLSASRRKGQNLKKILENSRGDS